MHGEYEFILADDNSAIVRVQFKVDENGRVSYDKPTLER